jgi:hypothetical protein
LEIFAARISATAHHPFFAGPRADLLALMPFVALTGLLVGQEKRLKKLGYLSCASSTSSRIRTMSPSDLHGPWPPRGAKGTTFIC